MFNLGKTFDLLSQLFLNTKWEHRVDDGDSLAWLAEKYGTTVNALKKFNNMKDDIIYSGRLVTQQSDVCRTGLVWWR